MIKARQSYRERQRRERAIARAEKEAWHREMVLIAETRTLAMQLAKDEIRASGRKVTDYAVKDIRRIAEGFEGPWLTARAQARIEQNSTDLRKR